MVRVSGTHLSDYYNKVIYDQLYTKTGSVYKGQNNKYGLWYVSRSTWVIGLTKSWTTSKRDYVGRMEKWKRDFLGLSSRDRHLTCPSHSGNWIELNPTGRDSSGYPGAYEPNANARVDCAGT